jgi:hypothetical protein
MIEAAFFIFGCLFSWSIAHFYYKRSSIQVPVWAKPLIANLPKDQPKLSELLRLFQKHLDSGEVIINPILGRVACPKCGESAKNFEENSVGDEYHTIVSYTCPTCGWYYDTEV